MSRKKYNDCPRCRKDTCFANDRGYCTILTDNTFKGDCPFYKDRWEKRLEDMRCESRLNRLREIELYERKVKQILQKINDSG